MLLGVGWRLTSGTLVCDVAHLSKKRASLPELAPRQAYNAACRLLGVVGPFPPPVWMSLSLWTQRCAVRCATEAVYVCACLQNRSVGQDYPWL